MFAMLTTRRSRSPQSAQRSSAIERAACSGVMPSAWRSARLLVEVLEVGLAARARRRARASGPWPGTITSASSARIRSHAAIQFETGPGPGDRVRAGEEDVAGEQHALGRGVHERVAARVRRPDLDQPQLAVADAQRQLAAEGLLRQHQLDARRSRTRRSSAGRTRRARPSAAPAPRARPSPPAAARSSPRRCAPRRRSARRRRAGCRSSGRRWRAC